MSKSRVSLTRQSCHVSTVLIIPVEIIFVTSNKYNPHIHIPHPVKDKVLVKVASKLTLHLSKPDWSFNSKSSDSNNDYISIFLIIDSLSNLFQKSMRSKRIITTIIIIIMVRDCNCNCHNNKTQLIFYFSLE